MNHESSMWITNTIFMFFFMLLLIDWLIVIIFLVTGSLLAIIAASFLTKTFFPASFNYLGFLFDYSVTIVIGIIFTNNQQTIGKIKHQSIKLQAYNQSKTEFIANMSHDIRTPMTGILGSLETIHYTAKNMFSKLTDSTLTTYTHILDNRFIKQLNTIIKLSDIGYKSSYVLMDLLNDILESIQIESDKNASSEIFDLNLTMQRSINLLKPIAFEKKLSLSLEIEHQIPRYLYGLPKQLDRSMLNIINNALKFTDQGSVSVYIDLTSDTRKTSYSVGDKVSLCIRIKDTGIGIPKDKFDTIFEQFYRLNASYKNQYKGSGLGLYAVKHYVQHWKRKLFYNDTPFHNSSRARSQKKCES